MKRRTRRLIKETLAAFAEGKERKPTEIVQFPLRQRMPKGVTPATMEEPGPVGQLLQRGIVATTPEAIVYLWLEKEGMPFEFQASLAGGRLIPGGAVADFIVHDREPPLVLRIQGTYWHAADPTKVYQDAIQRSILEASGYTVVDIWERWIYEDVEFALRMAFSGVDIGP